MARPQYTTQIKDTDCIGDSLLTINANFDSIDKKIGQTPVIIPGKGTDVKLDNIRNEQTVVSINTTNSIIYKESFSSRTGGVTLDSISLADGSAILVANFPLPSVDTNEKPWGSFTVAAPNNNPPKVSLHWTAAGNNVVTVYATNSAASVEDKGATFFNDSVKTVYRSGSALYVGGSFTEVGSQPHSKFVVLNIGESDNLDNAGYGTIGTILPNPLSGFDGDLGPDGEVNAIQLYGGSNILVVAGSFASFSKGRGLVLVKLDEPDFDRNNIAFYVNGVINCAYIIGNYLYVGGKFDYISHGPFEPDESSFRRVRTNGLAKIDLSKPEDPFCIDANFAAAASELFIEQATINSIAHCTIDILPSGSATQIYIGGEFTIRENAEVVSQNLAIIDDGGYRIDYWNPILNGPVHSLLFHYRIPITNDPILYVGGKFDEYKQVTFTAQEGVKCSNILAFSADLPSDEHQFPISLQHTWIPKINGPVFSIALQDHEEDGYVYCYGNFSLINEVQVTYLGAISKTTDATAGGFGVALSEWKPRLQSGPEKNNTALNMYGNSIIVGGTFNTINNKPRYKLARLSLPFHNLDLNTAGLGLSSVGWEVGAQLIGNGMPLSFDTAGAGVGYSSTRINRVSSISYAEADKFVTTTTFSPIIDQIHNCAAGQLYRFYIKRLGYTNWRLDAVPGSVCVIGCTVDFN